jgi:hypothetical protein
MSKLVLHIFHADPASLATVPALAERIHGARQPSSLEVYLFGPAEQALANPEAKAFNDQIDGLAKSGVRVTTCIGIAQKMGAEAAFTARGLALESAATAFPRFAAEGATVMSF